MQRPREGRREREKGRDGESEGGRARAYLSLSSQRPASLWWGPSRPGGGRGRCVQTCLRRRSESRRLFRSRTSSQTQMSVMFTGATSGSYANVAGRGLRLSEPAPSRPDLSPRSARPGVTTWNTEELPEPSPGSRAQ